MGPGSLAGLARHRRRELMDQPGLDPVEHAQALRGLGRINRVSRSEAILWPSIARLARASPGKSIRVLDLASGGGDVPMALTSRASRARLDVRIEGSDISTEAVRFARARSAELRSGDSLFGAGCSQRSDSRGLRRRHLLLVPAPS